ncbi:helix-turn-helix domain-containing protein [Amycolatopsis sp. NPDC049691]|uniref:TetR/AcrR family transcriptional regulator n=1 Tax=Amycolatopsis sp. NPDC049691 TaxID=3155155 RepID=UPI003441BD52
MAKTTVRKGHSGAALRPDAAQRRRQLAETAARWFHRYGFHHVSLADVASEVGLTAPALYRHFRNKKALLAAAVGAGLDVVEAAWENSGPEFAELLSGLVGAALQRRDLWALLQREVRHLDETERVAVDTRFERLVARLSSRMALERPDADDKQVRLFVVAVLGVLASPAVSGLRVSPAFYQGVLAAAALAAATVELPAPIDAAEPVAAPDDYARSRSEELLETAIALFHNRGYAAVKLDEIGAAVGLAGPSVYHHFATKSDLLVEAFSRAARGLGRSRGRAALADLVHSYIDLGVRQRQLFGVYVTEVVNLPPEDARRIRTELTADIAEWAAALRRSRPELAESTSLILVHAARGIVNDVVRVGGLHNRPGITGELDALVHAVLNADVS